MGPVFSPDDPETKIGYPMTENNSWPKADENQDSSDFEKFRTTMERYFNLLYEVSVDLMRLIAHGLGLDDNYFDSMFIPQHLSTFRLINYPVHNFEIPPDAYSPDDGRLLSTAAHRDSTVLTLLNTYDYEGLQVKTAHYNSVRSLPYFSLLGITYCMMHHRNLSANPTFWPYRCIDSRGVARIYDLVGLPFC